MRRRDVLRTLSTGTLAAGAGTLWSTPRLHAFESGQAPPAALKAAGSVRIRDIQTILTAPDRIRLVVVKVHTSEPGLYGVGCATFTQRASVVQTAIEQYLKPFLIGRDVDEIEDIWQSSYVSSYWRNGPVLFNAMSGVDIALWDIKGKRAGMPVYQLLGGKCRLGAACYYHAEGRDFQEAEDNARKGLALGYRHIRVQASVPGLATYGSPAAGASGDRPSTVGPTAPGAIWDSAPYVRMVPKLFEHMRTALGDDVELLHDVHERVTLPEAVNLCKALEPYRLFFVEDPAAAGERSLPDSASAVERAACDGRAVRYRTSTRGSPSASG